MKNILVTLLISLASFSVLVAQNIQTTTLDWRPSQGSDMITGEILESSGSIITTGKSSLEWKNTSGSIRYSFLVKEVVGTWSDVSKAGSITYEIAGEAGNGTATFLRAKEGIVVRLIFTKEGAQQLFELSNIVLEVL